MIKILKKYDVNPSKANKKVTFVEASAIRKPKEGLKCLFTKRNVQKSFNLQNITFYLIFVKFY